MIKWTKSSNYSQDKTIKDGLLIDFHLTTIIYIYNDLHRLNKRISKAKQAFSVFCCSMVVQLRSVLDVNYKVQQSIETAHSNE